MIDAGSCWPVDWALCTSVATRKLPSGAIKKGREKMFVQLEWCNDVALHSFVVHDQNLPDSDMLARITCQDISRHCFSILPMSLMILILAQHALIILTYSHVATQQNKRQEAHRIQQCLASDAMKAGVPHLSVSRSPSHSYPWRQSSRKIIWTFFRLVMGIASKLAGWFIYGK